MAYLSERPLALQQQIFAKLFEAAQVAAMTEEEQEQYFAQMLTERDRVSQMKTATRIGIEIGRKEALTESARKLKAQNVPIEVISSCTGLSVEEIMAL